MILCVFRVTAPTCRLVQEIGEQAAHDSLVADDQHVLLTLQFHDYRLQPLHEVLVGLGQKERDESNCRAQPGK